MKRIGPGPSPFEPDGDALPDVHIEGPAKLVPLFTLVRANSAAPGEGHVMRLSASYVPQEAIDLMLGHSVVDLIEHRAFWFPTDRFTSKDPLLTDLRIGRERGLFPVYLGRPPTSDAVANMGGVDLLVPGEILKGGAKAAASKWRRELIKLTKIPLPQAQHEVLDLAEIFDGLADADESIRVEVRLFEFREIGQRENFWPVVIIPTAPGQ
jgi:hypothetical protein